MAHDKSATESRALALLGQGLSASVVASALGVSDSRISQLLSAPEFASEVQKLRFENLQQSTEIDAKYNSLERDLLGKLEKALVTFTRPRDILQAISVINGAKRRGQATPDQDSMQSKVVQLQMPQVIQQKFITNNYQQVTEVRDVEGNSQTLVTASSSSLDGFAKKAGIGETAGEIGSEKYSPQNFIASGSEEVSREGLGESKRFERAFEGKIRAEDL